MIYIFAGNFNQAQYCAHWCELKKGEWRYVRGHQDLCGSERGSTMFLFGTWRYHSYNYVVRDTAYARDMTVVELFDRPRRMR